MKVDKKTMTSLNLFSGNQLKEFLGHDFSNSKKEIIIISPYITDAAIDEFITIIPKNITVTIVCRLLKSDVINGSCSISALKKSINKDWGVYCLERLHAKIYSIDSSKIYCGSSNATANGLQIGKEGNLEGCVEVSATQENNNFIQDICNASLVIDIEILDKMEKEVEESKETYHDNSNLKWTKNIFPETLDIWVNDFLLIENNNNFDSKFFKNLKATKWLISKLEESENHELYFGKITEYLHNDLKDDPVPYRSSVKELLSILLINVDKYMKEKIEISMPGEKSQRVKLL